MHSETKIKALIELLDDPDEFVFSQVEQELKLIGNDIVPILEYAWGNSFNNILQQRIENLIHQIQFERVLKDLTQWKNSQGRDLLDGALIIARYQYPDLDIGEMERFFEQLVKEVWLELNPNYTALEKARIISRVLFEIYGFSGNKKNFHSPQNSFINHVIESKKGNPITLSLIYLIIAKELKLPIYGVNLPEHFVLAYTILPEDFVDEFLQEDVLFYINPFNGGTIFNEEEIKTFLAQLKIEEEDSFFLPCSNLKVIERILNNLIFCFGKAGVMDKVEELKQLLHIIKS